MVQLVISEITNHRKFKSFVDALHKANIEYQLTMDLGEYGITPPYLIVDGVPLDETRAYKWVKERSEV